MCRGADEDLVHVHVRRLADRVHDGAGDVVGFQGVAGPVLEERRVDHSRLDKRDPHAAPAELLARGLAHRGNRPLGGGVEGAGDRPAARDRTGEEQVALRLAQGIDRRSDRQGRSVDVGEHHRLPVLRGVLLEAALGAEPGVGQYDVEAPEGIKRGAHHGLLVVPLGDVAAHDQRALLAAQLPGQIGQLVLGTGGEHHAVAVRGRGARRGGADPGGRAGDEEDGVVGHAPSVHDRAKIFVQGGRGGDGCMSFRREAHVPRGGPDGGDGGRGGDVVLVCDDSLRDLEGFRRRVHWKADRGRHGEGSLRHGRSGTALEVRVPPGTQVTGLDGERHDLVRAGQHAVVARGGPGGRGNKHFATATRQAPRFAERGLAGDEGWVDLRLKLLADVGLVGLPNAGKSSLLARLTRAQPKVAEYPFTTLAPVLGTLELADRQLVVADIPGLIEGASQGAGLGHDFLAHVERTRLLVHVLDLAPLDDSDPVTNHATIERELAAHDPRLPRLPRVLALSKADLVAPDAAEAAARAWRERLGDEVPVVVTSSATGRGLDELSALLGRSVAVAEPVLEAPAADQEDLAEHMTFRPAAGRGFEVERVGEGRWRVDGPGVERLVARHDLDNDEALAYLEDRLRAIGVIGALQAAGFEAGDDVEIGGVEFELDPGAPF